MIISKDEFGGFLVKLTQLDVLNRGKVFVSKARAEELLPKLNARSLPSEFDHPRRGNLSQDEWWRRSLTVPVDRCCCRLTQFRIEEIEAAWFLVAHAQPVGEFKEFVAGLLNEEPIKVQFGMRALTDDTTKDGVTTHDLKDIITFDLILS